MNQERKMEHKGVVRDCNKWQNNIQTVTRMSNNQCKKPQHPTVQEDFIIYIIVCIKIQWYFLTKNLHF